jgi:hypothetical protein
MKHGRDGASTRHVRSASAPRLGRRIALAPPNAMEDVQRGVRDDTLRPRPRQLGRRGNKDEQVRGEEIERRGVERGGFGRAAVRGRALAQLAVNGRGARRGRFGRILWLSARLRAAAARFPRGLLWCGGLRLRWRTGRRQRAAPPRGRHQQQHAQEGQGSRDGFHSAIIGSGCGESQSEDERTGTILTHSQVNKRFGPFLWPPSLSWTA